MQYRWRKDLDRLYGGPRFEGKVKVTARYKAHGTYLQGESTVFDFTEAAETETKRYIYVENISFVSAGTAQEDMSLNI